MNAKEILKQYAAGVRDFCGVDLSEENLNGANLSGADFSEANLSVANLSGANLSGANLSRAKLNVTRLSGANLSKANLIKASLNVANLIRADLAEAKLTQASLIRAELIRAELSRANLESANLSGADLREATLRQANLNHTNLSESDFRGASLSGAILESANLNGANFSKADLSGSNLRDADLRQANLSKANLSGADLSGANLRWTNLNQANLGWADLSNAKLSGANLRGADLSNANLLNASLVHTDLTQARLIKARWVGADLTGATLTGAKLYAVSRFGLKSSGVICDWVDLSPEGDQSEILHVSKENCSQFFNETLPTVRIIIDAPLDFKANLALASAYNQIAEFYPAFDTTPSLEVSDRRTELIFRIDSNTKLFTVAYLAILPFQDAKATQRHLLAIINTLQSQDLQFLGIRQQKQVWQFITTVSQSLAQIETRNRLKIAATLQESVDLFKAPTHTVVTNSSTQSLNIYYHPTFGRSLMNQASLLERSTSTSIQKSELLLPPIETVVEFIRACRYTGQPNST